MINIEEMILAATNDVDVGRSGLGRRNTVNFWGIHISIFSQSLFHCPKTCCVAHHIILFNQLYMDIIEDKQYYHLEYGDPG